MNILERQVRRESRSVLTNGAPEQVEEWGEVEIRPV